MRAIRVLVPMVVFGAGLVTVATLGNPTAALLYATYVGGGLFLVARRPTQPIGWLLVLMGGSMAVGLLPVRPDLDAMVAGDLSAVDRLAVWANGAAFAFVFVGLIGLVLVFPDGRIPDGPARTTAVALLAATAGLAALIAFNPVLGVEVAGSSATVDIPNPLVAVPMPLARLVPDTETLFPAMFGLMVPALASLLLRFRSARGLVRLQYRWLVWSLLVVTGATTAWATLTIAIPIDTVGVTRVAALLAYATVPVAIAVAVLRYRLYDIDRIVSRTVGWALATALVVGVFAGAVVGLQAVLGDYTQGNALAVAASTLLAFALFQPVRRRVQLAVDRRFDRPRLERAAALGAYGERLRHDVELATLERELVETVDGALRPAAAAIWLRAGGPSPGRRPAS